MLTIGICDDEKEIRDKIKNVVETNRKISDNVIIEFFKSKGGFYAYDRNLR